MLVGFIIVFPIFYAVMVSFMSPSDVSKYPPRVVPKAFLMDNYNSILASYPLFTFLKNSLIVCFIVICSQIILSSFAAYAFSYFKFPGKSLLFSAILTTMMIPPETIIVSNYVTISNLKLIDTYWAMILPYTVSGMAIFLMRQYYLTIPKELKQAAEIDGCSDIKFILYVTMPISLPTIASLGVYVFVLTYNQYMWPLLVTNSMNMRTVQIGMSMLIDSEALNYGNVTAGAVFVLLPVIAVFIFGQKYLIKGMTSGAVKG